MAMLIDMNVLEKEILKWLENPGGSDLCEREKALYEVLNFIAFMPSITMLDEDADALAHTQAYIRLKTIEANKVIKAVYDRSVDGAMIALKNALKNQKAMDRLGEFGELFIDYSGDPRGPIGRAGASSLEQEALYMDVIKDVDGGEWRPVQEDVLQDILKELPEHVEFEKKVIFYDNTEGITIWCCPKCNAEITVPEGSTPNESHINYCMHCGAKIDN